MDEPVTVWSSSIGTVRLLLVDSPRFADKRDVYTWTAEDERENQHRRKGTGHWDAHHMNLLLQRGALEAAAALGDPPAVFHCHDGHASFLPAIAREDPRLAPLLRDSRMVVTIHNAGEGLSPGDLGSARRVPAHRARRGGDREERAARQGRSVPARRFVRVGQHGFRAVRGRDARRARRARSPEGWAARTVNGASRCPGITNGVDGDAWDPRLPRRSGLPAAFDPGSGDLAGKRACRAGPRRAHRPSRGSRAAPGAAVRVRRSTHRAEGCRRAPGRDPHPRAGR